VGFAGTDNDPTLPGDTAVLVGYGHTRDLTPMWRHRSGWPYSTALHAAKPAALAGPLVLLLVPAAPPSLLLRKSAR
jgi:hypothetical protein